MYFTNNEEETRWFVIEGKSLIEALKLDEKALS